MMGGDYWRLVTHEFFRANGDPRLLAERLVNAKLQLYAALLALMTLMAIIVFAGAVR